MITRRNDLPYLLNELGLDRFGAELGVAKGEFSYHLLKHSNVKILFSIDRWSDHHDDKEYHGCLQTLAPFGGRSLVVRETFENAVLDVPDSFFDFIYIDGYAHTGQNNGRTLDDWWPKLKPGGLFAGHDYHTKWRATMIAVDRFMAKHDLHFELTVHDQYPSWITFKAEK